MDINSYNYTPHLLEENNTIFSFENDDMTASVTKERHYSSHIFFIDAYSYDGQLEIAEQTADEQTAKALFDYIVSNYSDTPPDPGTLSADIENIMKGV